MAFLFIDVKNITPAFSPEQTDTSKVERPAALIPACNGVLNLLEIKEETR